MSVKNLEVNNVLNLIDEKWGKKVVLLYIIYVTNEWIKKTILIH